MPLLPQPIVFSPLQAEHSPAQVSHIPYYDVQWDRPVFRPPSLPTQAQIWSDLPFTSRFNAKEQLRK